MHLPVALRQKYGGSFDADTEQFFSAFAEDKGSMVLEVGANEECAANILSDSGHWVVGLDLREYHSRTKTPPKCNYQFIRCDVNDLPRNFWTEFDGRFDAAFSLSALEHFGLGTYSEGIRSAYYDVIAVYNIWHLLRNGGNFYLTVPYGAKFIENCPHYRVYDVQALQDRIIQDFAVVEQLFFASGEAQGPAGIWPVGTVVSKQDADGYSGEPPHITTLLKLKKVASKRLAPDGR